MTAFNTMQLPAEADVEAPDGSDVRVLLQLAGGSMAHFTLAPGKVSRAVTHRTVEEIWYVVGGSGEMWRKHDGQEAVAALSVGTCLTIPLGTHFQFRATGNEPLSAVGITMPPWPTEREEASLVEGPWPPSA